METPLEAAPVRDVGRFAAGDVRSSMRADDGFVATFFSARIANWLLARVASTEIRPNQVTIASLGAGILGAGFFAAATPISLVIGAILLQVSFVLDCLDGQLARHRGQATPFGEWLDCMTDCLKEVVVIAAIAIGCARRDGSLAPVLWSYAALLVIFYRHFDWVLLARILGRGYSELLVNATAPRDDERKVRLVAAARQRMAPGWGPIARFLDWLAPKGTHEKNPIVYWTKRALLFRSGERYLVISALAAAGRPEWIFPVIVAWGGIVYPLTSARRWQLFGAG